MRLYLDSSAFAKRYASERGSDVIRVEAGRADAWLASRIAYVETLGVIGWRYGLDSDPARRFGADWASVAVTELTQERVELAAELVLSERLRSLDAIHLASALRTGPEGVSFATWDKRLWQAAQRHGFEMVPADL